MSVFLLLVLALLGAAWFWQRRVFLRHLEHLRRIIDDVAAGQRPTSFVFQKARDFSGFVWRLEHLHEEQNFLRKEVAEKKFNLDAVLASMIEGVLVVTETNVIRIVNDSFLKMFNLPANPTGQTVLRAVREAAVDGVLRETLERGAEQSREIAIHSMQAGTRQFNVNAVPLKNSADEVTGVVAVFHDLSRLRQLEDVRREFVANVSHELRTPLSIFQGYLENLLENPTMPRGEVAKILQIMSRHSSRLNLLLEDLLTLARLESRQETLDVSEFKLEPFLARLVSEWRQKLSSKKITVRLEIPDDFTVRADAFRMEQVFGNLFDNAVKFSAEAGQVTVRARGDDVPEIRIEDEGIGIPPADLPHVFERFYRVEKGRGRETGGTGLGLSIVKHIVAMHGGSVQAESQLGEGTAIVLRLPRKLGLSGKL